jgi:hypothetical protein
VKQFLKLDHNGFLPHSLHFINCLVVQRFNYTSAINRSKTLPFIFPYPPCCATGGTNLKDLQSSHNPECFTVRRNKALADKPKKTTSDLDWSEEIPHITVDVLLYTFYTLIYGNCSPPSWGFDVPLATALCKTFLLRMLNES